MIVVDLTVISGELQVTLPNTTKSGSNACLFSHDVHVVFVGHHNGSIFRWKLDDKTHTKFKAHSSGLFGGVNALALNDEGESLKE